MSAPAPPAHHRRLTRAATVAVALVALVASTSCIGTTPAGQTIRSDVPRQAPKEEFLPSTVKAANGFATDLFRTATSDQGNFVYSPYSILLALGMARAGSAGTTRDQFDHVLHADETPNLDEGLNTIDLTLEDRTGEKSSTMRKGRVSTSLEASVWGQRGTRFKAGYLDILAANYDSPMRVVDFQSDAETSREAINQWGADVTQGRISDLVPRGDVTAFTRFLAAAVSYLRAPWQVPFDRSKTRDGTFVRLDGTTIDSRVMQVSSSSGILTAEGNDWKAVDIPYLGEELSLLIVVPRADTFDSFQTSLDVGVLDGIVDELADDPVDLRVPQFQFTTSRDLTDLLEAQGLTDAFTREADFSGITSDEVLNLSGVAYQGYFGVDEEGTDAENTATAQTPVTPTPGATKVTVDRPFVFAVRDRETGLILLIGRVVSPS